MFELLFTSFPALIRYFMLRRRNEPITVWNMKTAVFLWFTMAFALFLVIFYYHPKTYAGVIPFRTVSVVSQTSGPVTEIAVANGDHVRAGDLLFRIEDSAQRAALAEAQSQLPVIDAKEAQAKDDEIVAQASIEEIEAELVKLRDELGDAQELVAKGVGATNSVIRLEASVAAAEAELRAARAQLDLARITLLESIPAERLAAEKAIDSAEVQLSYTEVRSFGDGTVTQLALSLGSPASTIVFRPAMIVIPDRPSGAAVPIWAGFSQVASDVLYENMPAEVACESNANLAFRNTFFPARIVAVQPAVAAGQIVPDAEIRDPKYAVVRGTVQARLELLYPEHEAYLLDGSGCIVQAYTNNMEGLLGHVVSLTGVIKAAGLRMKMLGAIIVGVGLGGDH